MDFFSNSVAIFLVVALVLLYDIWRVKNNRSKDVVPLPPQVSGGLPLIGHLHQLGGKKPLARILGSIADKYGPIFMIRLGAYRTVVISDYRIMKEFYTTNDRLLASRPQSSAAKYLGYNYAAFGFSPYGSYWRDLRKLTMVELLSSHRIRSMKHVQLSEVSYFIKDLFLRCKENNNNPVNVDMSELLENMVLNIITSLIAGKRYHDRDNNNGSDVEKGRHFGEIMKDFMYEAGAFIPSDLIPLLGWMEYLGSVRNMKKIMKELDNIFESWIEEHESKGNSTGNKDFIDVLLSAVEDDSQFGNPRRIVVKGTLLSLVLGGSDTTSITMTWLVASLLNNRRVLKVAQEEMDEKVGRERRVEESDLEKLVYLNAVIKETLRLFPAGPLAVPREAMEDCTLYGYDIPKGTRFLTNLWKLHRDPNIWQNPEEFKPERFLISHANLDYMGQHFEFLPFGSGRRSCPGLNFAMQVMQLTIARLLQGFNLATPKNEIVDMRESLTISLTKETPLHVMLTPRLAPQLYEQ